MINTVIELRWSEFRQKVLTWWDQRQSNQLGKVNNMRERSIRILQQRYGYTKEKATSELDKHYSKAWLG